jgi:3-oxoacyl-[acyl-carrier-protein] synthase III
MSVEQQLLQPSELPFGPMQSVIVGTGMAIPDHCVTNHDLAAIMDTTDEWITKRTGVRQRFCCAPGVGASELAIEACTMAMADANVQPSDVDLLVTATMTPDEFVPGIAPTVQHGLGLRQVGAFDIRQQCSGFLYGLDMADAAIVSGRARTVLVVGAESHTGYMPYGSSWEILRGQRTGPPDAEAYATATESRAWSVLFGDGAAAVVLQADPDAPGVLSSVLNTDGTLSDLIRVRAAGFKQQPWLDVAQITAGMHHPTFNGLELFRQAVRRMPEAVRHVVDAAGLTLADVDVVVAHQANERILDAVRKEMNVGTDIIPSNIARYGNTTAATLPLLFHELRQDGRIPSGALVCFTAFGAGAHWGALLYRHP